ncbi:hypothetical protein EVAR_21795_1 [Eumeta japonica]|uniref:Uncharacterized protein n=1 Tax=Eumeta variegata TaxID=151549 RepID=A0A4C1YJN3_EUMVA|nr:hypothetical protein EVAR_21795_1 [Eumeta japonica]
MTIVAAPSQQVTFQSYLSKFSTRNRSKHTHIKREIERLRVGGRRGEEKEKKRVWEGKREREKVEKESESGGERRRDRCVASAAPGAALIDSRELLFGRAALRRPVRGRASNEMSRCSLKL